MLSLTYNDNMDEVTVGVDEAGKGCMIGRVYAAAVIWDSSKDANGIKDSKKISRKNRKLLKEYIEQNALAYGVGWATNEEINEINTYGSMIMIVGGRTHICVSNELEQINK